MARDKPELAPEDLALFRDAIGPVRRIEREGPAAQPPRPAPRPRQREADELQALVDLATDPFAFGDGDSGEALAYVKPGIPPKILKQLKRGRFAVQDEIDLHHMNAAAAESSIRQFLAEARLHDLRCVRIIHGKGLRSKSQGPILKRLTEHMLRQRGDVLAFASGRASQGGTGAVLVLLARRRGGELLGSAASGDRDDEFDG